MPKLDDRLATFYASDRNQWREWLKQNHRTSSCIWLVYYKVKSGKPSVRYSEAVKEALCFGWVENAKRPETRLKRIEQTITSAAQNKNPLAR